ncbi:SARP family transcriptional regulator [Rhizocola hellebori]|uniref:SARP family transcriptional regulator n=1 Tax=Rhizocola hellebori TaxID=1392758 RepID=A0A8J3QEU9_9ACTN|nr:BTAD domain-containing putative transcriptional regulator [Rhizocola hellebori]GIH08302.1 SARP family transcriptional regulator [Rhizocola hellebori]
MLDGVSQGLRIRLLGPVEVIVAGQAQAVNGLRRRAVLATLALHAGRVVSTDRLIDVVWGDRSPATALNTLQRHVSYLRGLLGGAGTIVARPPGYLLDMGPDAVDVQAAERLVQLAQRATDPAERVACLQAAVALWRGQPLADLAELTRLEEQAEHLVRLRWGAERNLTEARLSLGEHAQLAPELERLARQHPLDEQVHAQLMLALYRSGRPGDAVAAFRRLRDALGKELGVGPSSKLRDLEAAIVRQDTAIDAPAPAGQWLVAAQLPSAVPTFAGRDAAMSTLDDLAGNGGVIVVSGTAGVGKTTLAVHWAHRNAARFPDGQLYVNLRGFDPADSAVEPQWALHGFLEALGVPAARMPSDLDGLVNLYRTMVAGRRLLVLLDNAREAGHVRPLLPAAPGCLAIVTSRDQLIPLVAAESAQPLRLDLLSLHEARDMLTLRLGQRRVAAEPAATEAIVDRCARLPLALAIVAARAATHPGFTLAEVAAQLRDLDAFDAGDDATDVRAVFSWSCRTLSPAAARLFRLLSRHPGPDISGRAAASLAAVPPGRIRPLLTELTRANLLTEHAYGRYSFHDLLRAYAADLAEQADSPGDRRAAMHRFLDYCLHTAHAADLALHPHFSRIAMETPQEGASPEHPRNRSEAEAWFTAEVAVLLAAVALAARCGFERHAWRLAWCLAGFLHRQGYWQDWLGTEHTALAAASRIADTAGQGHAHRNLALVCSRLGRFDEASEHLRRALDHFTACDDLAGQAHTYLGLGQVTERQGLYRDALDQSRQALTLFERAGCLPGRAYTLNAVGWQEGLLGDYHRAIELCEEALKLLVEVDDVQGQADTWDSLGYAHHQLGDHRRAIECYEHALEHFAQVNDQYGEASTYANIGGSQQAVGDGEAARAALSRALSILDTLGHADADRIRAELHRLDATVGTAA